MSNSKINREPWPTLTATCEACHGQEVDDQGRDCAVCQGQGYVTHAAGMGLYGELAAAHGCMDLAARMHRKALVLQQQEMANRRAGCHHDADLHAVERVTLLVVSRVLVVLADRAANGMPAPRGKAVPMPRPPLWRRVVRWVCGRAS